MIKAMRMSVPKRDLLFVAIMALGTTGVVWLPFLFHLTSFWAIALPAGGMETIKRNYDGLNYVIVAKSLYNAQDITQFGQNLPVHYFAAHLPGFPLTIRLFTLFTNYPNAMLASSIIFTVMAALAFYWLLRTLNIEDSKLWLCFLFLLLPPRWLVVHSVGSAEPLFETAILGSVIFFVRGIRHDPYTNFFIAGLLGALATITKTPGILLFFAYGLFVLWQLFKDRNWTARRVWTHLIVPSLSFLFIPLALLGVFWYYSLVFGDFLAYFHSGDNIHLALVPFQVFNSSQYWVGSIWLEDILFYFFIYTVAVVKLFTQRLYPIALFCAIFLFATMCVVHRDIARYSLPIAPFAILAFRHELEQPAVKIAIIILFLPIFLYATNFIAGNTLPTPTLAPYL